MYHLNNLRIVTVQACTPDSGNVVVTLVKCAKLSCFWFLPDRRDGPYCHKCILTEAAVRNEKQGD